MTDVEGGRPSAVALVALLLAIGIMALAYGIWPPITDATRLVDLSIAMVLLAAAAGLAASLRWRPRGSRHLVHVLLTMAWLSVAVITATRVSERGQITWGFPVVLCAVYAAYDLRRDAALFHLAGMTVAYVVAAGVFGVEPRTMFVALVAATALVAGLGLAEMRAGRERAEEALRSAADTDPLTGALNRRGLDARAVGLRAAASRAGRPTAAVMIDLDRFKHYNDTHGHRAGDELLVDLVSRWQPCLREGDLLARLGGDEFALVLPHADRTTAESLLARMRATTPDCWSAGHVTWLDREDLWTALSRADSELYAVKAHR